MTPLRQYQRNVQLGFDSDPAQLQAVTYLDDLYHRLQSPPQRARKRLFSRKRTALEPIRGLYLWGGVGRGKTYLMDLFYHQLPEGMKVRYHFHHFMRLVHHELGEFSGQSDPLKAIAYKLAQRMRVLCFDEFYVSDITDAMLLGTLLHELFARGVTLVATSNCHPDELYRNGLQRAKFLPAIELIQQHCTVVNVDSGIDYRLRTLTQAEIYHSPLDADAEHHLEQAFFQLTQSDEQQQETVIEIEQRQLKVRRSAHGVLLANFHEMCCTARSQLDYMEIAQRYHTVLLANVFVMGRECDDVARRFIALVDEFYDRKVKLIISAEVPLGDLYREGSLNFEFTRTRSRLEEMQSHHYLEMEHLP